MGEAWLLKQLEKKQKDAEDLAGVLWEKKWTAVAEVIIFHIFATSIPFIIINHSCATIPLKNMFSLTHLRSLGCTFMA